MLNLLINIKTDKPVSHKELGESPIQPNLIEYLDYYRAGELCMIHQSGIIKLATMKIKNQLIQQYMRLRNVLCNEALEVQEKRFWQHMHNEMRTPEEVIQGFNFMQINEVFIQALEEHTSKRALADKQKL